MNRYDRWRNDFRGDRVFNDLYDLPDYTLKYVFDSIEDFLIPELGCNPDECEPCEEAQTERYIQGYEQGLDDFEFEANYIADNLKRRLTS